MLQFMRKHAKNWLMKVLLILIIIVFVFYFGSRTGRQKAGDIATVGDKTISFVEFRKEYENLLELYRRQYGENLTEEQLKRLNLKQVAVDNLINQTIILQKAKELNVEVSDEEVRNFIFSIPTFQRNGVFDNRVYQQVLRSLKMTPEEFEVSQKMGMIAAKIEGLIRESVMVSDDEAFDIYRIQNEKTDLAFLKIPCEGYRSRVKASTEDLEKFLAEQGDSFRVPERLQVKYLFLRAEDFEDSVSVSDEEVRDYYESHRESFKKKGGSAAPLAEVKGKIIAALRRDKAMDLAYREAKKARNTIYQEENFEEYARKHNITIHSGEVTAKANIPPELAAIEGLDQYLSALKPDQITPVLSTPSGYAIIKLVSRESSRTPKLAEIRGIVERRYVEEEARKLCRKEAEDTLRRLKAGVGMDEIAREKGLRIGDTGYFSPGVNIPGIGRSLEIAQAVYLLSEKKPYPDQPFLVDDSYVIVRFKGRKMEAKDFDANKAAIKQFLYRHKENIYLQSWIAETKEALIKAGRIKFHEDVSKL
ncbi:MAG: SurA N-terminal domain-containing protein [Syntrophobacterales bacterium]|nr:SurA N-terminal domain-containing protein [Syntrophobacterales bacterium]